jgi:hypothetical protein
VIYGCAHVSGKSQDLAAQLADLEAAGCERIYREKISAETAERPRRAPARRKIVTQAVESKPPRRKIAPPSVDSAGAPASAPATDRFRHCRNSIRPACPAASALDTIPHQT